MGLLHVCWEKTLFGKLYMLPANTLFKRTLDGLRVTPPKLVTYRELFVVNSQNVATFQYAYDPTSRFVTTHMELWTGHLERLHYRCDKGGLVSFSWHQEGLPVSPAIAHALELKTDEDILLVSVSN